MSSHAFTSMRRPSLSDWCLHKTMLAGARAGLDSLAACKTGPGCCGAGRQQSSHSRWADVRPGHVLRGGEGRRQLASSSRRLLGGLHRLPEGPRGDPPRRRRRHPPRPPRADPQHPRSWPRSFLPGRPGCGVEQPGSMVGPRGGSAARLCPHLRCLPSTSVVGSGWLCRGMACSILLLSLWQAELLGGCWRGARQPGHACAESHAGRACGAGWIAKLGRSSRARTALVCLPVCARSVLGPGHQVQYRQDQV